MMLGEEPLSQPRPPPPYTVTVFSRNVQFSIVGAAPFVVIIPALN